jgi:hypothetical protein
MAGVNIVCNRYNLGAQQAVPQNSIHSLTLVTNCNYKKLLLSENGRNKYCILISVMKAGLRL